jgi:hypothetical protein
MGRKGVSKRKPKTTKSIGSSNTHQGDMSAVQSLLKDKSLPPNRIGTSPSAEVKEKNKKGK